MSTATEDRKSPIEELLEGTPFRDIGEPLKLAPETPLTREAAIHLRAAAMEIEVPAMRVRSMIRTVERALANPTGGKKSFSEHERMDLAELLLAADDILLEKVVSPVYGRSRGERPHGGIAESDEEVAGG